MAEANSHIDPIPYDADTPELDVDVEMEDSGDERGEANCMAGTEVLDALYLRETIESGNQNVQDIVLYWMKEYSDCVLAFQDISDAVCVHSINEVIVTIKKTLENIPNTTNQPLMPQTKENGKELKGN